MLHTLIHILHRVIHIILVIIIIFFMQAFSSTKQVLRSTGVLQCIARVVLRGNQSLARHSNRDNNRQSEESQAGV